MLGFRWGADAASVFNGLLLDNLPGMPIDERHGNVIRIPLGIHRRAPAVFGNEIADFLGIPINLPVLPISASPTAEGVSGVAESIFGEPSRGSVSHFLRSHRAGTAIRIELHRIAVGSPLRNERNDIAIGCR